METGDARAGGRAFVVTLDEERDRQLGAGKFLVATLPRGGLKLTTLRVFARGKRGTVAATCSGPVSRRSELEQICSSANAEYPTEFLHRCGDRFVGAITFEARVNALITFEGVEAGEREELPEDRRPAIRRARGRSSRPWSDLRGDALPREGGQRFR